MTHAVPCCCFRCNRFTGFSDAFARLKWPPSGCEEFDSKPPPPRAFFLPVFLLSSYFWAVFLAQIRFKKAIRLGPGNVLALMLQITTLCSSTPEFNPLKRLTDLATFGALKTGLFRITSRQPGFFVRAVFVVFFAPGDPSSISSICSTRDHRIKFSLGCNSHFYLH